jgi:hypothetical protein
MPWLLFCSPNPLNTALTPEALRRHCRQRLLDQAFEKLGLSVRTLDRILKVARTLADLAGSDAIRAARLAEAIEYRSPDRRVIGSRVRRSSKVKPSSIYSSEFPTTSKKP